MTGATKAVDSSSQCSTLDSHPRAPGLQAPGAAPSLRAISILLPHRALGLAVPMSIVCSHRVSTLIPARCRPDPHHRPPPMTLQSSQSLSGTGLELLGPHENLVSNLSDSASTWLPASYCSLLTVQPLSRMPMAQDPLPQLPRVTGGCRWGLMPTGWRSQYDLGSVPGPGIALRIVAQRNIVQTGLRPSPNCETRSGTQ